MINKKNLLGKTPDELGDKDAVHVAIVAVRAGAGILPGQWCKMNENREAVSTVAKDRSACGVADPFRKIAITRGEWFWLLLSQTEVPNVQHYWEHPSIDFTPPVVEVKRNEYIQRVADQCGVTYEQVMDAARYNAEHRGPAPYPEDGTKDPEKFEKMCDVGEIEMYDFWYEWSEEAVHEFANHGSECCPEYDFPVGPLFEKAGE